MKQGAAPSRETLQMTISVSSGDDTPVYYANFIEISHSPHDFTLAFVRVPSKPRADQLQLVQEGKPVSFDAAGQLVIPPTVLVGLIDALKRQQEKYEAKFGPITKETNKKGAK